MATITIDELVVKLGLDPTNFTKGQAEAVDSFKKTKDEAKKTAGDMDTDGKQAARFYGRIKDEALATIAVLIGAKDVGKFVGDTVTNLSAVGRIATVMGQATPDVIAIGMAVERIGGNAKESQQSLLGLSQALERYSRFGEGSIDFKRGLGLIGAGPGDTPLQVLQKFATWSQGKKPQDVELIGQQIGLNQDLINETIRGRKQFDADIAQSYKNGIPTDADIKKVQALQTAFGNLAQSLKFAGTELVLDVADPLTHLLNLVTQITHDFPTATKAVVALVTALITLKGLGLTAGAARGLLGIGGAGAAAPEAAAGGGVLPAVAGAVGIVAAAIPLTGASATPSTVGAFDRTMQNPEAASDADLRGAIAFAQHNLANAPPAYRKAAADALERLAQVGLKRWGDPRTGTHGVGGRGPTSPTGVGDRAAVAEAYLQQGGFSAEQSRGIVAGLFAESAGTLSPTIKNPNSTAYGIAQWVRSSGRQDLFRQVMGKDLHGSTYAEQLQFVLWELTHSQAAAGRAVRGQSTAAGAARAFLSGFEAPGAAGLAVDMRTASRFLAQGAAGGTTVTIGEVNVNTKATDAHGIARGIKRELAQQIASNSNGAVN